MTEIWLTKCKSIIELIVCALNSAAKAGFLSGFPGIESVPGPKLPEIEFLNRFNGLILTNDYHYANTQFKLNMSNGFILLFFYRRKPEEVCRTWWQIQIISSAQGIPWENQVEQRKVSFRSITNFSIKLSVKQLLAYTPRILQLSNLF